ncbi:MAG: AzlC family ABC transporter permease [Coriobacteriia bacterium]
MCPSDSRAVLPPTRKGQFIRGVKVGFPIFLGYLPVGLAFGIVAVQAGFSVPQAVACSAIALAGAGQFIGVSLVAAGAGLAEILVTNAIINIRYLLFGATIAPGLRGVPLWQHVLLAHTLTDETFALNTTEMRRGAATSWTMLGVGAVSWTAWVGATAVGALATSSIGDPSRWGIDYAMPAMFTALLVGQVESGRHLFTAGVAVVLTICAALVIPGSWSLVAASVGAATVASVVFR